MKFPGRRLSKHYFPVTESGRVRFDQDIALTQKIYVVGIDQLIVDIEIHGDEDLFTLFPMMSKGESVILPDDMIEAIYQKYKNENKIVGQFAGGSIGNTLHNYSVLADDVCVALGSISKNITVGDYAFKYICSTNSHVDFNHLHPCEGPMARAICYVTPDGERSFAVGKGIMNFFPPEAVQPELIQNSSALLISAYLLRDESAPIYHATIKACALAKEFNIPVILSLGSANIVREKKEDLLYFIKNYVNVLAMNNTEATALTDIEDPLKALESILDSVDFCLLTVGHKGLYVGALCEQDHLRETKDQIHSKSLAEYNRYEYSRSMLRKYCNNPVKIYSHINPYLGGPGTIRNTNGAGDAALSAVLHDVCANLYHKELVPQSPKHVGTFLTYSSIHQICKYANRVSFEVLKQNSPRLMKGLPEKEVSLEEVYWSQ